MDLEHKTLEDWLRNPPRGAYPFGKKVDYYSRYKALKDYLVQIHKQVTLGANLKNPDMLINDHGPDHIDTVIERATILARSKKCELTAYEVYMLLASIQMHDVGNIFGRYEHELNVDEIIIEADKLCGSDTIERMAIRAIAQAHGGVVPGTGHEKDKISLLNPIDNMISGKIRSQLIAGILRFADELADDKKRANTKLLNEKRIPKKSEVFHAYATCLDSVAIDHEKKTIELNFSVPKNYTLNKFGKLDQDVFLLDEIYSRVMKMHLERIYFMRFCKSSIDLEKISIVIKFYDQFFQIFPPISFEVYESGYPEEKPGGIYRLCPALVDQAGSKMDGEYVKKHIMKNPLMGAK
jgi:hypothetical protein